MAAFQFKCPQCREDVTAEDEMAGQVAACPICGKGIVIPRRPDGRLEKSSVKVSEGGVVRADATETPSCGTSEKVLPEELGEQDRSSDERNEHTAVDTASDGIALNEQVLREIKEMKSLMKWASVVLTISAVVFLGLSAALFASLSNANELTKVVKTIDYIATCLGRCVDTYTDYSSAFPKTIHFIKVGK